MRVVFRTDASTDIGSGHVIRCLTLAEALRSGSAMVAFVCRAHAGNLIDRIEGQGFAVARLPVDRSGWLGASTQQDVRETIAAFGVRPDWIVIDHYEIDAAWETAVRPHVGQTMVIDDLANRRHNCDLLLDQNLVADLEHRYDGLAPMGARLLLGPRYALLQPEYASLRREARPPTGPVRRILVYFGAADRSDLTGKTVSAFLSLDQPDIRLDAVNGTPTRGDALRAMAAGHPNVVVHEAMPTLVHLMAQADLAIGASGATSWERLCLRLPAIVVTLADNQVPIARELDRLGYAHWLGDVSTLEEPDIRRAIAERLGDSAASAFDHPSPVDGLGTRRVASVLLGERENASE